MTAPKHHILIKPKVESKARILGKRLKSFLVGSQLTVSFELTNIGSSAYPGGDLELQINWPNGQVVFKHFDIPRLGPNESKETPVFFTGTLSSGYALLHAYAVTGAKDGKPQLLYSSPGHPLETHHIYTILAKQPEEIYEFWGMIIAALSLLFLVAIELVRFIIWLIETFG